MIHSILMNRSEIDSVNLPHSLALKWVASGDEVVDSESIHQESICERVDQRIILTITM